MYTDSEVTGHKSRECHMYIIMISEGLALECSSFFFCVFFFLQQSTMVPSSITFNWRQCKDIPQGLSVSDQPVALNGKLYVRGWSETESRWTETVLEYIPHHDRWTELPPPSVEVFRVATLRGQLLVVGKSTNQITTTVQTFNEHSQQWVKTYPSMSVAAAGCEAVIGYQDHLIVAGGHTKECPTIDVNILDTITNQWKTAEPLPTKDQDYYSVLIGDTLYLAGICRTLLRTHVPTLISGAKSGVWEKLLNTPHYESTPVTIGNTLLTMGGCDQQLREAGGEPTTKIQMYNPTTNKWTRIGDLPEPMDPYGVIVNSELFVFPYHSQSVYIVNLTLSY